MPQRLRAETANSVGDIALTGNSELEGTITDERTGAPIANADLRVNGTDLATKSDAQGHYGFAGLSPNPIDIVATVAGLPANSRIQEDRCWEKYAASSFAT